ncbi:hypothetical protein CLU81_0548 [Flavobacterium sp. 9]|nr:hypothetical protein CLU81_0548 [Flavobacterium sp. 9]
MIETKLQSGLYTSIYEQEKTAQPTKLKPTLKYLLLIFIAVIVIFIVGCICFSIHLMHY